MTTTRMMMSGVAPRDPAGRESERRAAMLHYYERKVSVVVVSNPY